ncbi:MAG: DUF2029 domain-containing protein [Novosphingobium sp.]|nr:DUF2029 domain-containing protein [Novosphingobium sp.]
MNVDFLREANWLKSRTRGYLLLFAVINLAGLVFLVATSDNGVDRNGFLLGTDFLSFWTSGHMLQHGGAVYDQAAHIAAQNEYFVQKDGAFTAFFYPPSFLPFCWPLGFLGHFPALAAWLVTTGAFYIAVVSAWLREYRLFQPSRWLLIAAFPPVLITITHGQTSFLVAGLLGLATLLVPRAPVLSGALFGLATIKPQLGLLVPIALLLTGEWRVIVAAAASTIALALVATLLFGTDQWGQWMDLSTAVQDTMGLGGVEFAKMMSVFAAARLVGLPIPLAYALQIAVSLGVIAALARATWRVEWSPAIGAAMLAGAPLATPFVLDYDLVLLAFPLIWLATRTDRQPWERLVIALTFAAPAFARPLALSAAIPIMPLVLLVLFALVVRRAISENRSPRVGERIAA